MSTGMYAVVSVWAWRDVRDNNLCLTVLTCEMQFFQGMFILHGPQTELSQM